MCTASASQRNQHIEFPGLEAMCGERPRTCAVEVSCESSDPAQDFERRDIEIWPLATPRGNQVVDLVTRPLLSDD